MSKKTDLHRHLDDSTLEQVEDLIARTPSHGLVRAGTDTHRARRSCMDPFKNEVLEKVSKGWSYGRIANHLSINHGIQNVHKSSVMRRINFYLGGKK